MIAKTLIEQLAGTHGRDQITMFDAEVISTNESERTCDVYMVGGMSANKLTARLMASVGDGALIIPTDGSTVIVSTGLYLEPYISMVSDVDRIIWLGGEYGKVPIIEHPTDSTKGLFSKIQALEQLIVHLIGNYNLHTHVTPSGTSNATTFQESGTISPLTVKSDLEHPNISH